MFKQQLFLVLWSVPCCGANQGLQRRQTARTRPTGAPATTSQPSNESHKACKVPEKLGALRAERLYTPLTAQLWSAG